MKSLEGRNIAFLAAIVSILLLSSNAIVAVVAGGDASFFMYSFLNSALAGVVLLALRAQKLVELAKRIWRSPTFAIALVTKVINDVAFYFAVMEAREIEATIIVYLYPIMNVLVGSIILSDQYQRLKVRDWLLVAVSFASITVLAPVFSFSALSTVHFFAAAVSAAASVYVVLLQKVADDYKLDACNERDLLGILFLASAVVHIVILAVIFAASQSTFYSFVSLGSAPVVALLGIAWIAIAVYIFSELIWIRAARLYKSINLKSLFYLSPAFGALYFGFLGVDQIDDIVIFALTGVIASNFLIHQRNIDDLSFIAFLLGIIASAVALRVVDDTAIVERFTLSSDMFAALVTFVSIISGFVVLNALESYQRILQAFTAVVQIVAKDERLLELDIEPVIDRLGAEPDCALWEECVDNEKVFLERLRSNPELYQPYHNYLAARMASVSRAERTLMFLFSLILVPSILSQAIVAQNALFVGAFSAGLFLFLPLFVEEAASFRLGRPLTGVLLRRAIWLGNPEHSNVGYEARSRFGANEGAKWVIHGLLTFAACTATFLLLA